MLLEDLLFEIAEQTAFLFRLPGRRGLGGRRPRRLCGGLIGRLRRLWRRPGGLLRVRRLA
jgi:hypothetical protein